MSYIECDQNTRPRARSQSHSPHRPRLSAVSTRLRTVSWIRSASRARVACQWKAKPRISTTKPVVADSVTVSAVVERQLASASLRSWMTARRPTGFFRARTVAKAASPSASVISMVPAAAPKVVSGCDGPSTSRICRARAVCGSSGRLATMVPSPSATRTRRPAPAAQAGSACSSASEVRGRCGCRRAPGDRARRRNDRRAPRWSAWRRTRPGGDVRAPARAAPMQIVTMKAMMRTGTARRSSGSAVKRRR